jgi:hypothetical protein
MRSEEEIKLMKGGILLAIFTGIITFLIGYIAGKGWI